MNPPDLPRAGQIWRHYKGSTYRVFGLAHWTVDGNLAVVYQAVELPSHTSVGEIWVRPIGEFLGFTEDHQRRFVPIPATPEPEGVTS